MTDAPTTIWAHSHPAIGHGTWSKFETPRAVEYLRRDLCIPLANHEAAIAAAYEAAATCTEWTAWGERHNLTDASRRAIRALTPADASATIARMLADAKAEGMREAAGIAAVIATALKSHEAPIAGESAAVTADAIIAAADALSPRGEGKG